MGIFFGTDGVRGVVNNDLTEELAQMVGNALSRKSKHTKIIVGRDTRTSGSFLTTALSTGALKGGADVIDVGIVPTAGISYLVKHLGFDYGVVISASHNPKEYNGIKIFDASGRKLSEKEEDVLERNFASSQIVSSLKVGKYKYCPIKVNRYLDFLLKSVNGDLKGLKVVLDLANGASYKIAPKVFSMLGAEVIKINASSNGKKINENCGATNVKMLKNKVIAEKADVGFAFDGDADRLIAVDENGRIFDGDMLIYILACKFKNEGLLNANAVVGTSHTNTGLLIALNRKKINLVRTDVGDKYVIEAMEKMNLSLGGEQSGHIIMQNLLPTGDGILASLQVASHIIQSGKKLSQLFEAKLLCQINKNIIVSDKLKVLNNELLTQKISAIYAQIAPIGRVLVRASGTEPKIRVMVEHTDEKLAQQYADEIEKIILSI